ncbi:beta-ketoacyl synthase N-terminal-like domain-containing protein [Shewanella litorisediminis]|uniref:3-hydroxyacyl-[acyl-carrier-protein] dehydratase FabA n=1 Tax=Shewanella litorisediminis TaxID=1173586 RepID=A0ABX7G8N8_9GAMM|nr:3-hydroxyacyl-[acyl-carrier-protein] dehydratase FabA [Shewanella litorisediminis]QRH03583.1 3-hydroxyacyl-[acyl-carrier-protein] dehydratase FabA [Shewanella litorisediminis]
MAGRFPGADDLDAFWSLITEGKDAHSPICRDKLGAPVAAYLGEQGKSDRFYCDKGGYLRDFRFSPEGYAKPADAMATLASQVDEHQLWALDVARMALQSLNSGMDKRRCGVVMGTLSFPTKASNRAFLPLYHKAVENGLKARLPGFPPLQPFDGQSTLGSQPWLQDTAADASALISDCLGLEGVSLSLDAACASSVYAIKLACDYLATGKADVMLAGAVSGADPFFISMGFSIFHAFPEHGLSAPLDKHSGGLYAGEGAGVLVLKRLDDAKRDGDTIHGIIRGVGLSNDGRGQFVLSPASKGQIKAFERAYEDAGIAPGAVEVVECHATGTPLGDKVELSSLESFFESRLDGSAPPLIGSVKSNLTHLLTAAGMPGIIKLMLAMKHKLLPPTVRLTSPISSPKGLFGDDQMVTAARPWPAKPQNNAAMAGLSVFGFGGCNAHLVLESPDGAEALQALSSPDVSHSASDSFGIEGLAGHFGAATHVGELATLITDNKHALVPLPEGRWKGLEHLSAGSHDSAIQHVGGFIDGFELDFLRFRLPPHPGDRLVAQQLLLMKVADEAIRDADLKPGSKVAVLVAMETELELHQFRGRVNLHTQIADSLARAGIVLSDDEYQALEQLAMDAVLPSASLNQYTSYIGNIMASRVASQWDFSGPAFTLSAGELSVARALEVADNLCATQQLDAVVVAAVDLAASAEKVWHYGSALGAMGLPPGEGAGALVLKAGSKGRYGALTPPTFSRPDQANVEDITEHSPSCKLGRMLNVSGHSASARLGHCFAAANMASLQHSLLSLTLKGHGAESKAAVLLDGAMHSARVELRQTKAQQAALSQRLTEGLHAPAGKQLLQRIQLGGRDIRGHILSGELPCEGSIRAKLAQNTALTSNALESTASNATEQPPSQKNTEVPMTQNKTPQSPGYQPSSPGISAGISANSGSSINISQTGPVVQNRLAAMEAHQAFLQSREAGLKLARALMADITGDAAGISNAAIAAAVSENKPLQVTLPKVEISLPEVQRSQSKAELSLPKPELATPAAVEQTPLSQAVKDCIWDYADLVEYAEGDIAPVFGPDYAIIDSYKRRVRLPTTDYLLVSRVTKLDAKLGEYKPSTMTTEYDIPVDAPYLVDGQIPWAVAVESGQCDLMLISFLGIDLENKGERVYRLLDCTLTFLGDLPRGGDTLRYDISINNYARNGDTLLFFFSYECFVGDRLILKMDGGCAGFFTDAELADGKGVIRTEDEIKQRSAAMANPRSFTPLIACDTTAFGYDKVSRLLAADVAGCFGPSHDLGFHQPSLCFASEKFLMIEEVSKVDVKGGAWGLGLIEGHKQLEPDHWYFPCHFKDDQVMAGSLMAEGCGQLLQFYMLHLGLHKLTKNGRFQPLKDAPQKVRCRGQVLPQSNRLSYRMEVTDIGLTPSPWAKANIEIILDGKVVVDFQNLGVMLKEDEDCHRYGADNSRVDFPSHNAGVMLKEDEDCHRYGADNSRVDFPSHNTGVMLKEDEDCHRYGNDNQTAAISDNKALLEGRQASIHAPLMTHEPDLNATPIKGVVPVKHIEAPVTKDYSPKSANRIPDSVPFTPWHLFEFATGNIENCFGPEFAVYRGLIPPRTPCGDLQLTTRVVEVKGKRGDFKSPASCIGEYEVPPKAWYFAENSHPARMPYSILMEIALQPNGFISGYMGTTLGFPGLELFFRNLDGEGTLIKDIDLRGKTISNDSCLLSTVMSGTNIIQTFSFALAADGEPFYEGKAVFGYFKAEALTHQLGLDNGKVTTPWIEAEHLSPDISYNLRDSACALYQAAPGKPHLRLPGGRLNFVDRVDIVRAGGKAGLGYVYGERTIDPSDWFFRFHFHQDPVMPGSLGVEAIIELLSSFALDAGLGNEFANPRFNHCLSRVKWKYRGQISPLNRQMSLELHITAIERETGRVTLKADAWLAKDGLRIYEISDLALAIEEA